MEENLACIGSTTLPNDNAITGQRMLPCTRDKKGPMEVREPQGEIGLGWLGLGLLGCSWCNSSTPRTSYLLAEKGKKIRSKSSNFVSKRWMTVLGQSLTVPMILSFKATLALKPTTSTATCQEMSVGMCDSRMIDPTSLLNLRLRYRKHFAIPAEWKGSNVYIEFDGVFHVTQMWVNGQYQGRHMAGYNGFTLRLDNISSVW